MADSLTLHYERAQSSLKEEPAYTVLLCQHILKQYPERLEVRKLLREAQSRIIKPLWIQQLALTYYRLICIFNKNPKKQLVLAEKALAQNSKTVWALQMLAKAATQLELWDTVIYTYECLQGLPGETVSDRLELCRAYLKTNNTQAALELSDFIFKQTPHCMEALQISRQASVRQALATNGIRPYALPSESNIVKESSKDFICSHSDHNTH